MGIMNNVVLYWTQYAPNREQEHFTNSTGHEAKEEHKRNYFLLFTLQGSDRTCSVFRFLDVSWLRLCWLWDNKVQWNNWFNEEYSSRSCPVLYPSLAADQHPTMLGTLYPLVCAGTCSLCGIIFSLLSRQLHPPLQSMT